MSDKHLQARKALTLNTGIFSLSSLALVGTTIVKAVAGAALFGTLSFWGILALILIGLSYFRGAWKAFGNLEYSKSKRSGLMASLSGIGAAIIAFII